MIIFKVQADRIQSNDETTTAWVAVKVSAVWNPAPAPASQADVNALLPWHWETLAGGEAWTPHDPDSWVLWTIDPADPATVNHLDGAMVVQAVSQPVTIPNFTSRLDDAVTAIAVTNGAIRESSLALPDPQKPTPLEGSVPGLVERLASMPHPVPSAARVHALLEISNLPAAGALDGLLIIAAPRLTPLAGQPFDPDQIAPQFVSDPDHPDNLTWSIADAQVRVEAKPTRTVSAMRANVASGRLLDLFDQTIAVSADPRHVPATAAALAELPQALADAMDPLARLTSVLGDTLRTWGDASILEKDLYSDDPAKAPPAKLKRMLDAIAVQVLGARYDAVGRFEVPLFEALESRKEETAAAELLGKHVAALPFGVDGDPVPEAAWRVDPATLFDPSDPAVPGDFAAASPFTLDQLRLLAGFETKTDADRPAPPLETDLLRLLWSHWAAPIAPPGSQQGLRYLELPREQPAGALNRPLQLVQRLETRDLPPPGSGAAKDPFADVSFERARASAALAFAAPFIEGLVAGRTDWSTTQPGDVSQPLFERLRAGLQTLLLGDGQFQGLYETLRDKAAPFGKAAPGEPLYDLLTLILSNAAKEAVALGTALGPRVDPFATATPMPLPLRVQIDQLQTFSRHIDDWTRLAGYGLLARRAGPAAHDPTAFVSLNAATLWFGAGAPAVAANSRFVGKAADLLAGRLAIPGVAADGTFRDHIDPDPFAPGDQVGVSDAIAEYRNAWQTAPMPGAAAIDEHAGPAGVEAARILVGSPGQSAKTLPTLTSGRTYALCGHLIAQGGVLAPFARHPANPYVLRDDITDGGAPLTVEFLYLRTVGVSGPGFRTDHPPKPDSIDLLADELPKRPPARPLDATGFRMNIDPATGLPKIACAPGADGGVRFEFVVDAQSASTLNLTVEGIDPPGETIPVAIAAGRGIWYRLDLFRTGQADLRKREVGVQAEDEFRPDPQWTLVAQSPLAVPPDAVSLRLASNGAIEVEALRVVTIAGTPGQATEMSESGGVDAPRAAALLLDGLDVGAGRHLSNGLVRSSARVRIEGPSVDRYTWESWVNCALFASAAPAGVKTDVARRLNELQTQGTAAASELPDPAVSGLWLEVWEVFPTRRLIEAPLTVFTSGALEERPAFPLDVRVGNSLDPQAATFRKPPGAKVAAAVLVPGCVYEVRARSIIRPDAKPFDGLTPNAARFGSAVLETFCEASQAGSKLLLGPASVLPIEVATAQMPALVRARWIADDVVPLRWEGSSRVVDLTFPTRLFDGADGGRQKLRYCKSASLVPQHWTWRGRPVPQGRDHVFDYAFAGRRDDDHGRLITGALRVHHALGLQPGAASAPAIATRDLDWRGGWNLWRFGVRLTSRYHALFQAPADSAAVHDLHAGAEGTWLDRSVPDAANGRAIAKPALVLVLPLTEAGPDNGLVPPLLALLAEPMHVNGNFGDGVAVAVDVARHPLPAFKLVPPPDPLEPQQTLKYLPEVGPDPARFSAAHPGDAVALKLDGPIGYGFDVGSEAGRFTHSGFLITPMRHRLAPWTLIKIKMRRLEQSGHPGSDRPEQGPLLLRGLAAPDGSPGDPLALDHMAFDGLVATKLEYTPGTPFDIAFHRAANLTDRPSGQRVQLQIRQDLGQWRIEASVLPIAPANDAEWRKDANTPNAGSFTFDAGPQRPEIRLVVSTRPKPDEGKVWAPSGDVLIQVTLGDSGPDEGGSGWLTIFNLPIEAGHMEPIASEPSVNLGVPAQIERVRLSEMSPSIWCQFTIASSRMRIDRDGVPTVVDVEVLDLRPPDGARDQSFTNMVLHEGGSARRLLPDADLAGFETSELVEACIAIFTENAFDISAQARERPLIALLLEDRPLSPQDNRKVTGAKRILWQNDKSVRPGSPGRWRLLRLLQRRGEEITSLADLFHETFDGVSDQPEDARGMLLTVSRPFAIRSN